MNTKDRILIEALSLFSVQGFSGVSVRDISKSIGLRESAMYKHYKNNYDFKLSGRTYSELEDYINHQGEFLPD